MSGTRAREAEHSASGRRVAIVAARFNDVIVSALLKAALATWAKRGGEEQSLLRGHRCARLCDTR